MPSSNKVRKVTSENYPTDAGREGELIFRLVYQQAGCKKPFSRLWLSSMEENAIREGFAHLKPSTEYDALYNAALCRERADWMVGINASRLFSCLYGQPLAVGRVMTPVLAMTVVREAAIAAFTPERFYTVALTLADGGTASSKRFAQKEDAELLLSKCRKEGRATVQKMERKEKSESPPQLYDLTALQRDANRLLGFTAQQTLDYAQSLYEKRLITYPRTDSRFLTEDMAASIPGLVTDTGKAFALEEPLPIRVQQVINGSKVTDHHALLITENLPEGLSQDEQAIYEMVAARLLEAFLPCCVKEMTEVALSAGGEIFTLKSAVIKSAGWRAVCGEPEEEAEETTLPGLQTGETLPLLASETVEKQTKPKPLHTESSLLSAMEHCGKEISDEQLRAGIREIGIGTPATRAAVIETLFARDYIRRDKKNLVPTEKGLAVYDTVKDKKIADVEMTAAWENTLAKIETGEADAFSFRRNIEVYTAQIVTELLAATLDVAPSGEQCTCPKCRKSRILFFDKVAKCADVDCSFTLFRNKGGKILTDGQIIELATKGRTPLVKGFKSREGKSFDAALVLNPDFTISYSFPDRKPQEKKSGRKK